jgi:hypothetical protein
MTIYRGIYPGQFAATPDAPQKTSVPAALIWPFVAGYDHGHHRGGSAVGGAADPASDL